ncbi:MAG: hypothetical protein NXI12_05955 [Alphaproteobacteria bacterium]|nr:hypothetical protein [Alphaproteobacteria bacterium]
MRIWLAAAAAALLAACTAEAPPDPPAPRVVAEGWPQVLSAWGQLAAGGGELVLGEQVTPYDLNTALFSDYALKLRTVWIPDGAGAAQYDETAAFDFPVGSVITKTFYYPRDGGDLTRVRADGASMEHFDGRALDLTEVRLVETRILVRREDGWDAASYLWNDDQREARLARTGAFVDLTLVSAGDEAQGLDYLVPNTNQCANCHVTDTTDGRGVRPIGPKARHLNRDFEYFGRTANQIAVWTEAGLLEGAPAPEAAPQSAAWISGIPMGALELEAAARSYIDINCAHCHSRTGQADTSGLYLEPWEPFGPNFGVCKPPIAAGRGTGNRSFGIVPGNADASIFAFRMASTRADIMMPELGRASTHEEGAELISAWIDSMAGGCG